MNEDLPGIRNGSACPTGTQSPDLLGGSQAVSGACISSMDNKGWIKLHRKLWDNPRSKDPDWVAVWAWLLTHATHNGADVMFNGKRIRLKPGQLTLGRSQIARDLNISESKIWRLMKCFKSEQQIEQLTSYACSLVTILNWAEYQQSEQLSEQRMNSQRTANEQLMNTKQECKNERMEEKTEKEASQPTLSLETELPKGFPMTEDEAVAQCGMAGVPEDIVKLAWNKAMGRGGRDRGGALIQRFANYAKTEYTYHQNREAELKARQKAYATNRANPKPNFRNQEMGVDAAKKGLEIAAFVKRQQEERDKKYGTPKN